MSRSGLENHNLYKYKGLVITQDEIFDLYLDLKDLFGDDDGELDQSDIDRLLGGGNDDDTQKLVDTRYLGKMSWHDAMTAVENAQNWRLPTIEELEWIYENPDKVDKPQFAFDKGPHWSSTISKNSLPWGFNFSNGLCFDYDKHIRHSCVLVRKNLKIINTIIKTKDLGVLSWHDAMAAVEGDKTWRLPSIDELEWMYEFQDKIDKPFDSTRYWSSTEVNAALACYLHFLNGWRSSFYKTAIYSTRAIRRDQFDDLGGK